MLEPYDTEIRRELAAARVATLHRSALPSHAGPLRRAVGDAFVRLGLLLGSDASVPPSVGQHESPTETLAPGVSTSFPSWWSPSDATGGATFLTSEADLAWESAAPYGIRVGDPFSRMRSRSGSRPASPSARSRDSRRRARFDGR